MNDILAAFFRLERHVVKRARMPFGLSYALLLRRPATALTGGRREPATP
jgi:hypothetical protein